MAPARNRKFRIEQVSKIGAAALENDDIETRRHRELMEAISEIGEGGGAPVEMPAEMLAKHRADLEEAQRLKSEIAEMYEAISRTKQEIASVHHEGFAAGKGEAQPAFSELDEVVRHTEQATETILSSAEAIEHNSGNLIAALKGTANKNMADEIHDQVINIFEACNFQDVTGQRITKVVGTLKFIEERITGIMAIWGGEDAFRDVAPNLSRPPEGDKALLHGPSAMDDPTTASQDDIDALFD